MYKLETGIEIPPRKYITAKKDKSKYPFSKMQIGMSFLIPKRETGGDLDKLHKRVHALLYVARKKHGFKFTMRRLEKGIRIWRTA